jgi:hypothetical protein
MSDDLELIAHSTPPRRLDLERILVAEHGVDGMYLGACSASTTYGEALRRGLITLDQYEAARERSGRLWNYCGD